MGVRPKFKKADIDKVGVQMLERIEQAITSRLQYIGETFVNNARNKNRSDGGFGDVTGNLRSSIGYIVLKDGKRVSENLKQTAKGSEGVATAKKIFNELKVKFNKGFVLIVIAGMDYAAALESKNKDVITGSSLIAEQDLREAITSLTKKISRR